MRTASNISAAAALTSVAVSPPDAVCASAKIAVSSALRSSPISAAPASQCTRCSRSERRASVIPAGDKSECLRVQIEALQDSPKRADVRTRCRLTPVEQAGDTRGPIFYGALRPHPGGC